MTAITWYGSDRFRAHGDIDALAFSPDGALLAIGSGLGDDVSVWHLATGALLARADVPTDSIVFDGPDTLWIAYAQTRRWRFRASAPDPFMEVGSPIALSPDRALLAASRPPGERREIVLCDVHQRRIVWAVPTATARVRSIEFSPDGRVVVVADGDAARLLDVEDGRVLAVLRPLVAGPNVLAAVAGPRDAFLVVGVGTNTIDLPSGERVTLPFAVDALSIGGGLAVSGSHRGDLAFVDLSTAAVRNLSGASPRTSRCVVVTDGRWVATSVHQLTRVFDVAANDWLDDGVGHREELSAVAVSPDGQRVATGGGFDGMVRLWRALDGEAAGVLEGHQNRVQAIAFSPDSGRIATACADGATRIFDAVSGVLVAADEAGPEVSGVVWARELVTITIDGVVAVRSPDSHERRTVGNVGVRSYLGLTPAIAAPPHGGWLAASGSRGELVAFDAATFERRMERERMGQLLAACPGAPWVVLRDGDDTTLVELPGGSVVHRWERLLTIAAAFDRFGRLVLLPFGEPAIFCDPTRPDRQQRVDPLPARARCLAFAPDGRLVQGLVDGRAALVEVPLSTVERRTRAFARRFEQARALLDAVGAAHAGSGYRTAPPRAEVEGHRATIAIEEIHVTATVVDEHTTELRVSHAGTVAPVPEAVETFATRMSRWLRRRLGRAEARDDRAREPWLAALPGAQRASAIRLVEEPGHLAVAFDLDELPSRDVLREWIARCRAHFDPSDP